MLIGGACLLLLAYVTIASFDRASVAVEQTAFTRPAVSAKESLWDAARSGARAASKLLSQPHRIPGLST